MGEFVDDPDGPEISPMLYREWTFTEVFPIEPYVEPLPLAVSRIETENNLDYLDMPLLQWMALMPLVTMMIAFPELLERLYLWLYRPQLLAGMNYGPKDDGYAPD